MRWCSYNMDTMRYECCHCKYVNDTYLGMSSHIQKHKREMKKGQKQTTIDQKQTTIDQHKPQLKGVF